MGIGLSHLDRIKSHLSRIESHLSRIESHLSRIESHPYRTESHLGDVLFEILTDRNIKDISWE